MAWLEMSRTPDERLPLWGVGERLLSPQRNELGHKAGFWETMLDVRRGDVVFHLCGSKNASFTGSSVASNDGGPIDFGPRGSEELYEVSLQDYTLFDPPIPLKSVFHSKEAQLRSYFEENSKRPSGAKERLFYVIQSGRLQCQNGAYLSQLSDQLIEILFGIQNNSSTSQVRIASQETAAGTSVRSAVVRLGQQKFSENVKSNFGLTCCFPGCQVSDPRFLIGSHIARWADVEKARGRTDNGLCLCVLHDRAFEVGVFALDSRLRVRLHHCDRTSEWIRSHILPGEGLRISKAQIDPSVEFLKHHWKRVKASPEITSDG